ncbi:MAG: biotin transporter BioY [Firmicutes bacterium]|nr:biotin transporter BioY [Bacillota bacterium]
MAVTARAADRPGTLADALVVRSLARDAALVLGTALFTAALAQVEIRLAFTPVPITGQTLAFLLSGAALGGRRGALSQILYVLMGTVGLPFFAGGAHGLEVLLGASGGYLVGGVVCAYAVGRLAEHGFDRRALTALGAMAVGEVCVYGPGLVNLARFVPAGHLLVDGLIPFIPGDVLKMLIAAGLLPLAWRVVGRRPRPGAA